MSNFCPVCKSAINDNTVKCSVCNFTDLHREFITKEDAQEWLESVVLPYRKQWENRKKDLNDFEIEGTILKRYEGNAKKVVIPNSVNSIAERAFRRCEWLTEIVIPASVKFIGDGAFGGCVRLTDIIVQKDNVNYISDDGVLFNRDRTELLCFPCEKREIKYDIPNGVQSIGNNSFEGCMYLTEVTIPNSVHSIGADAFCMCVSLAKIVIPDSVQSIGEFAFCDCEELTEIVLSNRVKSIGEHAFGACKSLTEVSIPNSVQSVGAGAFDECINLKKAYVPSKLHIPLNTFEGCHPDIEIIRY